MSSLLSPAAKWSELANRFYFRHAIATHEHGPDWGSGQRRSVGRSQRVPDYDDAGGLYRESGEIDGENFNETSGSDYNPIYYSNIGGSIVVGCSLAGPIAIARDPNKIVRLGMTVR